MYNAGQVLFNVTPADDQAVIEAREYIAEKKLTADNAKIVKRTDGRGVESLMVILKKDADI